MKTCNHKITELTQTQRSEVSHYNHKKIRYTKYYRCCQCSASLYTQTEEMDRLVPLLPVDA